jgi:hypothetical protein
MAWMDKARTHRRIVDELSKSLVQETQRFLDGKYLEIAYVCGHDMPVTTWLSTLAHGDRDVLERASKWTVEYGNARPEFETWGRVLAVTAGQILATTSEVNCSLGQLQRDLLIPLELAIMTTPVGPATLYRLINSMLIELKARVCE